MCVLSLSIILCYTYKSPEKPGGTKMSILNSPIKIGDLTIKNRLVMPPMATAKATADGQVTKQICD